MPRFGQVVTAMVTPFHKDGSLNLDGAKRLARWLQDNGNDGLVLAGTTGEAPVLTDDERLSLFKAVVESVTIPVIAGTGTNDTAHSIHMTKEASKLGVAGILAVTPYYNRPSQAGIEAHMRAVCGATDLPVVIYDIPVRTGRKINTPTLAKLANEVKNVAGVKDAAGNPAESARLMTMVPKSFELISGDDGLTLPLMAVGCTAVIGVATHWSGVDHQEMFTKWNAGDTAGARAVNARLVESFAFETGDDNPNPLPTKAMMNHLGLDVGEARLPMGPPPAGLSERAAHVMKNLVAARG
ncbi:MAG: 4-hydroxy-tetrahydrodipicolinate synthase [Actinobacteria bacterium]|nr:4-hydroxy-tetrahydrodipicolinate synthase [Actinomycetota bacterium]NBR92273.1 4-hydroxy-tetrahydrodipicolinate synthase [Actinomycetota bacterium]NBY57305.1 4-hydroxy-tetrahydrodipicolinate synthase [Actinomycetota bacterium]